MFAIHDLSKVYKSKCTEYIPLTFSTPVVIEGVSEIETLCPVSNVTGHRANPLTLLQLALSDKNSRLLHSLLQELPVVQQMQGVDDDTKLDLLASRLATGSLAEHDQLVSQLEKVTDVLFPKSPELVKAASEQAIKFDNSDVPPASPDAV